MHSRRLLMLAGALLAVLLAFLTATQEDIERLRPTTSLWHRVECLYRKMRFAPTVLHALSAPACAYRSARLPPESNSAQTSSSTDPISDAHLTGAPSTPPSRVVIVTACSAHQHYFARLRNFVGSVHFWEPQLWMMLFDLGLTAEQRAIVATWHAVELIQFPFQNYPAHVRELTNFAWKPLAMQQALQRYPTILFQDAGQEFRQPIDDVLELIDRDGSFFVVQEGLHTDLQCCGHIGELCHPDTVRSLGFDVAEMAPKVMCAGGIQAYTRGGLAHERVLNPAAVCALDPLCIAPLGSSKSNHRYDQAVFSVLLAANHIECQRDTRFWANIGNNAAHGGIPRGKQFTKTNNVVLFTRRGWSHGVGWDYSWESFIRKRPVASSENKHTGGSDP